MVHTAEDDPAHVLLELVCGFERSLHHSRIIDLPGLFDDLIQRAFEGQGLPIWPLDRQRIESIGHGKDPGPMGDIIAFEPRG